ncbi:exosome complex RNA-binding protein Csl4 [Candidatus Micrarchaeota archaeon]|nr:exosome complex RNA-binding protein Csl4 [Candidatus Micrarchaeota archaeon]
MNLSNKRLVLPGDHLSSYEEAEPGENSYGELDEVYSCAVGQFEEAGGKAAVKSPGRVLEKPRVGMEVYCVVKRTSPSKALLLCMPAAEVEGKGRGLSFDAALPVNGIKNAYVKEVSDEVRIGDIIRAKVRAITSKGVDVSTVSVDCGVVHAFCVRCRNPLAAVGSGYACGECGNKEQRKSAQGQNKPLI